MTESEQIILKRLDSYLKELESGNGNHCRFERLAVERHFADLKRTDVYFDKRAFLNFVLFTTLFKNVEGRWAGKPIVLANWELFIASQIFGWKKSDGTRKYTYADVIIPRKNGKTTFAALIALYMLIADGEFGGQVYVAAMDTNQSSLCWKTARQLAKTADPIISENLHFFQYSIVDPNTNSTFKALSGDTGNKDGLNPNCVVCDERHAWKTNDLFDVIRSAIGARKQPLIFSITTAGKDLSLPYYDTYCYLKQILEGSIVADNQFVIIYEPDAGADWHDEGIWYQVNPMLGATIKIDYFRDEFRDAVNRGGTTEANFRTKNLNQWVDAPDVWIKDDFVKSCTLGITDAELAGKQCFVGFDFAGLLDVCALALYFPDVNGRKALKMKFWIPEKKMLENKDRIDYRLWEQQGWITIVHSDAVDMDIVISEVLQDALLYDIKRFTFDPWGMNPYLQRFSDASPVLFSKMLSIAQTFKNLSGPTKEMEQLITTSSIELFNNPVLRWMISNVELMRDTNGNVKIDKKGNKSNKKIDGVAATLDAIAGYYEFTNDPNNRIVSWDAPCGVNF